MESIRPILSGLWYYGDCHFSPSMDDWDSVFQSCSLSLSNGVCIFQRRALPMIPLWCRSKSSPFLWLSAYLFHSTIVDRNLFIYVFVCAWVAWNILKQGCGSRSLFPLTNSNFLNFLMHCFKVVLTDRRVPTPLSLMIFPLVVMYRSVGYMTRLHKTWSRNIIHFIMCLIGRLLLSSFRRNFWSQNSINCFLKVAVFSLRPWTPIKMWPP